MASKANKAPAIPGFASHSGDYSRFENYEIETMNRSDLKGAPYNPRQMTEAAKKKLRDNLQKRGLMNPPVWNKRTGNVVSGHQRLDQLDALHGGTDYRLRVAVVDLDETSEKEQNVFFNNLEAQGDWDLEKLQDVFKTEGIQLENTGFDMGDIYDLFGESPFVDNPRSLEVLSEQLREAHGVLAKIVGKAEDRDDPDFYLVVVFPSYKQRKAWTDEIGLEDTRYTSKEKLVDAITKSVQVTSSE